MTDRTKVPTEEFGFWKLGMTREQRRRLPKAKLFWVKNYRRTGRFYFLKTRGANFAAVWIGPFQIGWRMPWLERSARQLHPEIFAPPRLREGRL